VAEKPSDVRECARAGPRRRAERADLTGLAHGAEREDKGVRATARRLAIQVRETERESAGAKENWRRQVGPTEQRARERERESGRSGLRRQVELACQAERARGRARGLAY
jgi:hypothetical protein